MRKSSVWVMLAVASCCQMAAQAGPLRESANVYAAGSGQLLYREVHLIIPGPTLERWVLYQCADGEAFARKQVQSLQRPESPNFAFEDGRSGLREGVRGTAGRARGLPARSRRG